LDGLKPDHPDAQDLFKKLKAVGWIEEKLKKGGHEGLGYIIREPAGDMFIEWHPGGGHHGPSPYWKFSSGITGTLRIQDGVIFAIFVLVPGAEHVAKGDINGAAREVAIESTPVRWSVWGAKILGKLFDWIEEDVYGPEYHQEMEEYRRQYWEEKLK
jgi:hypothetical protein